MASRVEKQTLDGTNVVVGYGTVSIPSYTPPVPPATTGTTTYTTQDAVVDVEIDYSPFYERIATALETIATNSTTVATNSTTIAQKMTAIEAHQNRIKELGEGVGYRIKGPYDIFGMVTVYKLLIEEAKILEGDATTSAKQQEALTRVREYMQKISANIPKEF